MCIKSERFFVLVDCNNFFVSCERVFNPALRDVPVIVLSNNDGCIVARSNETKALGIPMGAPLYKQKDIIDRHNIRVFSSNFTLYGDLSERVMACLEHFSDQLEIYSIDEAFLTISWSEQKSLLEFAKCIRETVLQWTGIPVSVGIGKTKTLAKAANEYAKKHSNSGVLVLDNQAARETALQKIKISDVWGVGRRWGEKLRTYGVDTAFDLAKHNPRFIRQKFNVFLSRTQLELQGQACLPLDYAPADRKSLVVSRSFGRKVTAYQEMEEAVCSYATRAAEKLRKHQLKAKLFTVFIRTNPFSTTDERYSNTCQLSLLRHANDTEVLIEIAIRALKNIYRAGYRYTKAGVMLLDLIPEDCLQYDFFLSNAYNVGDPNLMESLDYLNKRFGRNTVSYASSGLQKNWMMRSAKRTPNYTSNWEQLLKVA